MSASVSIKGTMETILRLSIPLLHGTQHMRGRRSAEVSVSTGEVLTCCSCCRRELTGRDDNNGLHSCTGRHQSLITASERPAPRRAANAAAPRRNYLSALWCDEIRRNAATNSAPTQPRDPQCQLTIGIICCDTVRSDISFTTWNRCCSELV